MKHGQEVGSVEVVQKGEQVLWSGSFASSVKRMIAYQVEREMARQSLTRARMAEMMGTSRAALNRLLDPDNDSVTLQTMEKAAQVLGKRLQIFLND
jgi:DNA-binding Xre family transcriptional regulator